MQPHGRTVVALTLTAMSASCAASSGKVTPLGITVERDSHLTLNVTFTSEARADITELVNEVRVENVSEKPIDGDCFSQVVMMLDQPLGPGRSWSKESPGTAYKTSDPARGLDHRARSEGVEPPTF
jgi:hypothetical protein